MRREQESERGFEKCNQAPLLFLPVFLGRLVVACLWEEIRKKIGIN